MPEPGGQQAEAQVEAETDGVDHRAAGAAEVQADVRVGDVRGKDGPPLAGDLQHAGHAQVDAQAGQHAVNQRDAPAIQGDLPGDPVNDQGTA